MLSYEQKLINAIIKSHINDKVVNEIRPLVDSLAEDVACIMDENGVDISKFTDVEQKCLAKLYIITCIEGEEYPEK